VIQQICLATVLILFLLRAPSAIRQHKTRATWFATGAGLLSLFTLGFVIPAGILDAALGGTNLLTLLRDVCGTISFWFFRDALGDYSGATYRLRSPLFLLGLLGTYTILFLAIPNRGTTSENFIAAHIRDTATWLYATIYILGIAALVIDACWMVRRRLKSVLIVFGLGSAIAVLGCLVEARYLAVAHFGVGGSGYAHAHENDATFPFYLGTILIVCGIGGVALSSRISGLQLGWRLTCRQLQRIETRCMLELSIHAEDRIGGTDDRPQDRAYATLVNLRNWEVLHPDVIRLGDHKVISRASAAFSSIQAIAAR
jgi:hypothetical protein